MTATPNQKGYIMDLLDKKELVFNPGHTVEQLKAQVDGLTKDRASAWIDRLTSLPNKQQMELHRDRIERPEPKAGMYRLADGTIVRVYLGQNSGRMLAKRLNVEDDGSAIYVYMGKATRFITASVKPLPLEEAKEFGRMTGTCCVCARRLDVPESVDAGIGPVCAKRMTEGFDKGEVDQTRALRDRFGYDGEYA